MGQIVLWDNFSHKGNKSLIALWDFISNTGEYIKHNGLPHPKGCWPDVFKGVSTYCKKVSPYASHPPGFGKWGTTPCEKHNTFKISGFTVTDRWGIRQRFRLLATAAPITTNLSKKTLEWSVSLNTLDLKRRHQQLQFRQCRSSQR